MYGDEAEGEDVERQEKQDLNLHPARATHIPTQGLSLKRPTSSARTSLTNNQSVGQVVNHSTTFRYILQKLQLFVHH